MVVVVVVVVVVEVEAFGVTGFLGSITLLFYIEGTEFRVRICFCY